MGREIHLVRLIVSLRRVPMLLSIQQIVLLNHLDLHLAVIMKRWTNYWPRHFSIHVLLVVCWRRVWGPHSANMFCQQTWYEAEFHRAPRFIAVINVAISPRTTKIPLPGGAILQRCVCMCARDDDDPYLSEGDLVTKTKTLFGGFGKFLIVGSRFPKSLFSN